MQLPVVRQMFQPDPGYLICDVDLDRADLQIVVWEADDEDLKRKLRAGVDVHLTNAFDLFEISGPAEDELKADHPRYDEHCKTWYKQRKFAKSFIHGTNYLGSAKTMAKASHIPVPQSAMLQQRWFALHPGIHEWHNNVRNSIYQSGMVRNAFGFRRPYFDRPDSVLTEAVAWIPQSTVALVINQAWQNLLKHHAKDVQVLLQNHDSLVFQIPERTFTRILPEIHESFLVPIPYSDPLTIPVGIKASRRSWGHTRAIPWDYADRVTW